MALSIKTEEADRLARELAGLTGETMTAAVTEALRERLARVRERRAAGPDRGERLLGFAEEIRAEYDTRPVTREDWDAAGGDDG